MGVSFNGIVFLMGVSVYSHRMFWRVVGHMNNTQRQQLLYFATGSASLPSSSDEEQCKSSFYDCKSA